MNKKKFAEAARRAKLRKKRDADYALRLVNSADRNRKALESNAYTQEKPKHALFFEEDTLQKLWENRPSLEEIESRERSRKIKYSRVSRVSDPEGLLALVLQPIPAGEQKLLRQLLLNYDYETNLTEYPTMSMSRSEQSVYSRSKVGLKKKNIIKVYKKGCRTSNEVLIFNPEHIQPNSSNRDTILINWSYAK